MTYASIALILICLGVSVYFYGVLPDKIASHWNAAGEVNGYSSRAFGLFFVPGLMIVLFLVFLFLPKIDPLKKNYKKFRSYYNWFVFSFLLFMFYIHVLTIMWNFYNFNLTVFMIPAFSFLFYNLGIVLSNARMNWFVGIRTPWTLSSKDNWNRTHVFSGKLFRISAVICLLGLFFQRFAIWFMLVPIILSSIVAVVYSYWISRKN